MYKRRLDQVEINITKNIMRFKMGERTEKLKYADSLREIMEHTDDRFDWL